MGRAGPTVLLAAAAALIVAAGPIAGWQVSAAATGAVTLGIWCLLANDRSLGRLLIATTLLSRVRVDVGGIAVIPEHAATVVLLAVGSLRPARPVARGLRLVPAAAWVFVAWGVAVSVAFAPSPLGSLRISAWISLSVLLACLLTGLYARSGGWRALVDDGARLAAVSASVGVACWVAASTVGSTFGVQSDTLTGTPAAFGLSYEANIFGGICAMWFLVDLLFVHRPLRAALLVRVPLVLGVATSLTRAAIVALVVGVAVNALMSPSGRRVVRRISVPAGLLVVALLVAVPAVPALAPIVDKASQVTDLESATTKVRFDSWEVAAGDLRPGSIAVGLGVNSFGQRHEDPTRPHESVPGYIGNVFLQLVYDSGLVGLGLLAGSTLVMVLALRRRAPQVVAVLAAGAVIALATSPLWFGNWWVLFAAASTAAYAGPVQRRSQAASPLEVPAH